MRKGQQAPDFKEMENAMILGGKGERAVNMGRMRGAGQPGKRRKRSAFATQGELLRGKNAARFPMAGRERKFRSEKDGKVRRNGGRAFRECRGVSPRHPSTAHQEYRNDSPEQSAKRICPACEAHEPVPCFKIHDRG